LRRAQGPRRTPVPLGPDGPPAASRLVQTLSAQGILHAARPVRDHNSLWNQYLHDWHLTSFWCPQGRQTHNLASQQLAHPRARDTTCHPQTAHERHGISRLCGLPAVCGITTRRSPVASTEIFQDLPVNPADQQDQNRPSGLLADHALLPRAPPDHSPYHPLIPFSLKTFCAGFRYYFHEICIAQLNTPANHEPTHIS
jgi:hypothetical protein